MPRQLYGGAISCSIPDNYVDASDLRQVPDTQEVFMAPDSDLSLIVEVLELVKQDGAGDSLEKALKYHFDSLAHDNAALSSEVSHYNLPSSAPHPQGPGLATLLGPATLEGTQTVSKFNKPDSEADTVLIQLALWRIPDRDADVTLSVNWPVRSGATGEERDATEARKVFDEAWRSFQINDFGLFAGSAS